MRSISCSPSLSNKHSSTFVAFAENSAKLTPSPFQVAPSGNGSPSRRRDLRVTGVFGKSVRAFMPAIPSCGWDRQTGASRLRSYLPLRKVGSHAERPASLYLNAKLGAGWSDSVGHL